MKYIWMEVGGSPCVLTVPDDYGEAVVRGRKWRWDYTNWGGPRFLNKDGSYRKRPPSEKHPVWKSFEKWALASACDKEWLTDADIEAIIDGWLGAKEDKP